ncbi:MAG: Tm-1-like ATP-binding domain-containing protein [Deltaproteobacteria bacterium]|nr:Tm-1-like ATP-binding domain-containing protein [Deltaproteobacteria bacterium]
MKKTLAIAVLGTFDSKSEEHFFLKKQIEKRGLRTMTINVGTRAPSPMPVDIDLFQNVRNATPGLPEGRDNIINSMLQEAKNQINKLHQNNKISGIISAGGGTGTHICTAIMHELPLGVPKIMVSTVASRDMSRVVGTKDIVMFHSVADLLGVNSISGLILDKAAAGICGMVQSQWRPSKERKRIALPFFGFITPGAEATRRELESLGYEVIAFHANGTGGMAMEELAEDGYFHGILDLATHELADELMDGYCAGIGPQRFEPIPGRSIPRLVVPGGLDCAVLEFSRTDIPEEYKDRKIFFYDFRSAIRLNAEETSLLAAQLAEKLNKEPVNIKVLVPSRGWSGADRKDGPLYDPDITQVFLQKFRQGLDSTIKIQEVDHHINDEAFGQVAAKLMDEMVKSQHSIALPNTA